MRWCPSVHVPILVLLAVACLALAPALFLNRIPAQTSLVGDYGPWWSSGIPKETISGGDSFFVYLPDRLAAVREWKAGKLPLWNQYLGGGLPMLGMQTANPLDPFIFLHLMFSLGRALGIAYAALLFIAGLGMVLFLRGRGLEHPAALCVAGVAFALNPYFLSWLELRVFLAGLAMVPLALWALDELTSSAARPRHTGVLALTLGYAGLAGTLQTFALFLGTLVLRAIWSAWTGRRSSRGLRLTGSAFVLGLAIGILPLIASGELLHHSIRLEAARGYYATSNFLPWRAVGLWMNHDLFGRIEGSNSPFWSVLHRTTNSSSGWGALGIVPLFLAIFALLRRAGPRSERIFWGGLSAVVLGFLFLMNTKFAGLMKAIWPDIHAFDLLRGLFLVNLGGAVLAGWGTQELIHVWTSGRLRTWLLPFVIYVLAGGLAIAAARHGLDEAPPLFRVILPLVLVAGAVVIIGTSQSMPASGKAWLLVLLVALDLCRIHFLVNPFSDPHTAYPRPKILDSIKADFGPPDYPRFFVFSHIRAFPPNTASVFGLPDLRTYSNLPIAGFREFLEWAEGTPMANQEFLLHPDSPIYRMLGARYLFSTAVPPQSSYVGEPLPDFPVGLFRRPDALPRAYLVHDIVRVHDRGALRTVLTDPRFDPAARVFLVGDGGGTIPCAPAREPDRVNIREHASTRVSIEVRTDAPGVLVLSDVFYPGWGAKVNGQRATILPAYGGLRGVRVPAGSSTIEMEYRPAWLWPGLAVTILGIVLALWLFANAPRRVNASAVPSSS